MDYVLSAVYTKLFNIETSQWHVLRHLLYDKDTYMCIIIQAINPARVGHFNFPKQIYLLMIAMIWVVIAYIKTQNVFKACKQAFDF